VLGQPPATPAGEGDCDQNKGCGEPFCAHSPASDGAAVSDVFCKGHPFCAGGFADSVLAAGLLEAAHPGVLFEAEGAEIAADEATPEDTSGKLTEVTCLKGEDMLGGDLGRLADGLDRHAP